MYLCSWNLNDDGHSNNKQYDDDNYKMKDKEIMLQCQYSHDSVILQAQAA